MRVYYPTNIVTHGTKRPKNSIFRFNILILHYIIDLDDKVERGGRLVEKIHMSKTHEAIQALSEASVPSPRNRQLQHSWGRPRCEDGKMEILKTKVYAKKT